MKAVICNAPFKIEIVDRPPPVRRDGEVMVRINRIGLCGTDYHIFAGNQPFLSYPRVMGHELAGTVAECDEHSKFKVGQLVTINPYLPCGRCVACRKSKPNCCVNINVLGVHIDGGMTEFLSVPEAAVVNVDGLTADQAAMVEFLSIGMHAIRRGRVTHEDQVLVVGAGPIGVGVALFAKLAGADVSLIDTNMDRLNQARDIIGIQAVHLVDETLADWLSQRTSGDFFDVVLDATGNAKAIESGFAYVAHGGRYVLVSVVKDQISFADPEFHKREMELIGSRNATHADFGRVIDLIRSGLVPTAKLHTQGFALDNLPSMLPQLIANQGAVLKAIAEI